jgi:nitrogenase iron protein NifH
MMKKIAFYGKGGIGKSVIVSNIAASLAQRGLTVMQIGCDPKADSSINLLGGKSVPTVLEMIREKESRVQLSDFITRGAFGVLCVESGGPPPGTGCAGRGIISVFEKLAELQAFDCFKPDVVLYDVLGDVVCGGFAVPIRNGYADEVCIVTSGEMMSLYAANNIATAVRTYGKWGYSSLRGLILNKRNIDNEMNLAQKAAAEMRTEIIYEIERDNLVQQAEQMNKTVVEAFPHSRQALAYRQLAEIVYNKEGSNDQFASDFE